MSKNWGQGAGTWYRHVVQVRVRARGTGTWCRYVYGHMVQARGGSAGHTSPRRAFDSLRICYDENFRRNAGCLRSLPHYTDVSVICFTQADFFSSQCIRLSVSVLTILHVVFLRVVK